MLAIMGILTNLLAFIINSYATQTTIHYKIHQQIADIAGNLIPAAIMCMLVYCLNRLSLPRIPLLFIQVFTGIIVYLALSLLLKNESFFYLLEFLKNTFKKQWQ